MEDDLQKAEHKKPCKAPQKYRQRTQYYLWNEDGNTPNYIQLNVLSAYDILCRKKGGKRKQKKYFNMQLVVVEA